MKVMPENSKCIINCEINHGMVKTKKIKDPSSQKIWNKHSQPRIS